MKLKNKALLILLLPFLLLAFSCSVDNSAAQNGYIEVKIKRTSSGNDLGYQTYTFEVPPYGFDKIYAARTTADTNSLADQYIIRGLSDSDVPFNAVEVHLTPADESNGVEATATVRLAEYSDSYTNQSTGFFWTISASTHGLNAQDYHLPLTTGGILTLDFATSENDGVYEAGYNNNTSNYPLLSIRLAAPTKAY